MYTKYMTTISAKISKTVIISKFQNLYVEK